MNGSRSVLLRGGVVVDPGQGTEVPADVRLTGGEIDEVGPSLPINGARTVEVDGCVVGPGLVDIHSHAHSLAGHRLRALDGATSVLDLEAGLMPIGRALQEHQDEGRPLNFGFSASWGAARALVLAGAEPDAQIGTLMSTLADPRWQGGSTSLQRRSWLAMLDAEMAAGALGVGVLLGYAPGVEVSEFLPVAALAAQRGAGVFVHVRDPIEMDPGARVDGPTELVRAAATGAKVHHCHVNATSGRHIERVLSSITESRANGQAVSVEAYPYGAGSTAVGAAFLAPEKLAARGLKPQSIVLLETGERLADAARLREIRELEPASPCIVEFLDENNVRDASFLRSALAFDDAIVASDATPVVLPPGYKDDEWPLPIGTRTHPRTSGTFAKTARLMVGRGQWTWSEFFRRASLLPAELVAGMAPSMRARGRIAHGYAADVVVLDPGQYTDCATYLEPTRPSVGVLHSFVNGVQVIREGSLTGATPGQPIAAVSN